MPIAVGTPKNSKDSPKGIGFRLNDRSNSTRTTGPRFGWLKGLVLMLLPGPANGLLLKLAHVAAVSGLGEISSIFGGVVKFLTAAAVLSVLLTIDYTVVKGVFDAIGEVAGKAKATAQQIVEGLVTLGRIVLCRNPTLDTVVQTFLELSDRRD